MKENDDNDEFGEPELEQLARKWLEEIRNNLDASDSGQAVVLMNFSAPPEVQWRFILFAVSLSESDDELDAMAAGPIEHLLGRHGESYIGVIENEVAANPKLARAVTGVWRHQMTNEVWSRVQILQEGVSEPLSSVVDRAAVANNPVYKTWMRLREKEKKDGFKCLSDVEKTFYRIYFLEVAAYSGGLEVWFDQGEHLDQVVPALRNVGADKSARIIEDAMKFVFPEGIAPLDLAASPSHIPVYDDANRAWFTSFERFEEAYREDPDNLDLLLIAYARDHNFLVE